jgi:hypothetical protein
MARLHPFLGAQVDDHAAVLGDLGHIRIQSGQDEAFGIRRYRMRLEAVDFLIFFDLDSRSPARTGAMVLASTKVAGSSSRSRTAWPKVDAGDAQERPEPGSRNSSPTRNT